MTQCGDSSRQSHGLAEEGADGGLGSPSETHTDVGTFVVQKHSDSLEPESLHFNKLPCEVDDGTFSFLDSTAYVARV